MYKRLALKMLTVSLTRVILYNKRFLYRQNVFKTYKKIFIKGSVKDTYSHRQPNLISSSQELIFN